MDKLSTEDQARVDELAKLLQSADARPLRNAIDAALAFYEYCLAKRAGADGN